MLPGVCRATVDLQPGWPEVLWDGGQTNGVGKWGISVHRSKEKIRSVMRSLSVGKEGGLFQLGTEEKQVGGKQVVVADKVEGGSDEPPGNEKGVMVVWKSRKIGWRVAQLAALVQGLRPPRESVGAEPGQPLVPESSLESAQPAEVEQGPPVPTGKVKGEEVQHRPAESV
ncbi:hypothetical protein AXF42_Ash009372 [Apostasia shenzhenica]|uniref:Uncharacterized protein n=1 Tax=Apostasia shenzhenica TaxID=1088818 RepID=A0A2I0B3X4_9ASPA|nr:hypothetical protein AXF42_Ash009372 [Apostasia shenzhenica]